MLLRSETAIDSLDAIEADVVVLAAGAWSGQIARRLPIRPLKGQMIALTTNAAPPLRHVVFTTSAYLVPRDDRLLVGATAEEAEFDTTVTATATAQLRRAATAAIPALADAPLADAWTGLRPMTPDGAPLLGWLDSRTMVATGHGRNGILLTPITADYVARLALGEPVDGIEPFGVGRFAARSPA